MQRETLRKIGKFFLAIIGGGIITLGTTKLFFGHAAFNFYHILLKFKGIIPLEDKNMIDS